MKAFIFFLTLLSIAYVSLALAGDVPSDTRWIDTNSVLISNQQNPDIARRDCETTMRILSIMSNDKIIFRSMCEPSYNPRCVYYYCYQLNVKALVIDEHRREE
ncbi:MAG: hypothetical protein H7281_14360 [Bacteriovorax sp.]|nr:hypothetical protein [Bacteriovorax sp.]